MITLAKKNLNKDSDVSITIQSPSSVKNNFEKYNNNDGDCIVIEMSETLNLYSSFLASVIIIVSEKLWILLATQAFFVVYKHTFSVLTTFILLLYQSQFFQCIKGTYKGYSFLPCMNRVL